MPGPEGFDYGPKRPDGQYENHPEAPRPKYVAPLRDEYVHLNCNGRTFIGQRGIVETYATNPTYYGSTFCAQCRDYFPLREFRWVERGKGITGFVLGQVDGTPGEDLTTYVYRRGTSKIG